MFNPISFPIFLRLFLGLGRQFGLLYSHHHDQLYKYTCRNITTQWRRRDTVLRKIYLSLYWKGSKGLLKVYCERELETEQNCNILTPTLMAISVVSFSFSRVAQPEAWGPTPLGAGFLYHILSPTGLVSKLTDFLSSPSYIIVQSPTQYLPMTGHRMCHLRRPWNSMFDRHQAEITIMQFTGHSLPVRQSVSVPWDFNPVPQRQPSSPTPMEYALPSSLEWHVWPGRRSIYNNISVSLFVVVVLFFLLFCFLLVFCFVLFFLLGSVQLSGKI